MKIAVLGLGSWGTALGMVLAENGHQVLGWGIQDEVVTAINQNHQNPYYLKEAVLSPNFQATSDLAAAIDQASVILMVLPVKAINEVSQQLNTLLKGQDQVPLIVHAAKGIEPGTFRRVSQMIADHIDRGLYQEIVVLSGPSHAEEVARHDLTTVTSASLDPKAAEQVQDIFMNDYFRVYTNEDMLGVELGGALKNIIAVASGVVDGQGYGDNARAALITRGLAEMTRLGICLGADPHTFSGLSGVGDLIVTCMSPHSRNFQAGRLIGQGHTLEDATQSIHMVVEGVSTCQAAYQLAQELKIEMPITESLYQVLYGGLEVEDSLKALMRREKTKEVNYLGAADFKQNICQNSSKALD